MKRRCTILLLLALPLTVRAQEEVSAPLPENSRFTQQMKDAMEGKASDFANKNFNTTPFNTKILNGKSANLAKGANNFSFPNNTFSRQFQAGSFDGFGGSYVVPENKKFATDRFFELNRRPFSGKVVAVTVDRDSGKSFGAQNWDKKYRDAGRMYQGKELTELGSYSGTLVLHGKDDMNWGQETISSEQIKEILNKDK
ncbi:MAG: hypothetical protein LBD30_05085 [Verrucomicrobiales bacterium]|jgi:hypothetical protein|nr:hypothetical protein [Verrucomicrobiales bacterium]